MKRMILLFVLIVLSGCRSNQKKATLNPLAGVDQFEVVLFFEFSKALDRDSFLKMVISSFEKFGNVHVSEQNVFSIKSTLPVLLLSCELGEENKSSIRIFAETEVLINRYRACSQIWELELNDHKNSFYPEIEDHKVVFKKIQNPIEEINPQQLPAKVIEQFAKAYRDSNSKRPTFYICSNFL